jgi:hypothetical protein
MPQHKINNWTRETGTPEPEKILYKKEHEANETQSTMGNFLKEIE